MKTIGIIGGMSFESTVEYYKIINKEVNDRLNGLHSAKMVIESYDFDEIERLQSAQNWDKLAEILIKSAKKLQNFGADYIAIATNTMHLLAPDVQKNIDVPLIHIANATGNYVLKNKMDKVALFGTKYTMTKPFYKDILTDEFNIDVIIPNQNEQNLINDIIYQELCKGIIKNSSRDILLDIINSCRLQGAKAVVLGCTELPNIIKTASIPVIDTTYVHCLEITDRILSWFSICKKNSKI